MSRSHYDKYRKKKVVEAKPDEVPEKLSKEDYPPYETLNSNTSRRLSIKMHWPLFYAYLDKNYPDGEFEWREKVYCFYHDMKTRPVCKVCGGRVKFHTGKGFAECCSTKCSNSSKDKIQSIEQSKLEKYGDKHYVNPEKAKDTKVERYGDANYNNRKDACKTMMDRYGGIGNASKEIADKQRQAMMERYGVNSNLELASVQQKNRDIHKCHKGVIVGKSVSTRRKNFVSKNSDWLLEIAEDGTWHGRCPHPDTCDKCDFKYYEISPTQHQYRSTHPSIEQCTRLLPIQTFANSGTSLEMFVRDLLDKHNVEYECNDRSVLKKQELDIYIPSKNIAIECNGVYWHSDINKDRLYHFNKWKSCKGQGIQMLSVWEDQIVHHPDIINSIILSKLGIYSHKVGARECELREASSEEAKEFLDANHLQGNTNAPIRIGLYYKEELVSLMAFGKQRQFMNHGYKDQCWELYRFCNKTGWQVRGGASKIFQHFINQYNPTQVISFASHDISDGHLYEKLGFKFVREQQASYWYIEQTKLIRHHRYEFNKQNLIKQGADPNLTEFQIMDTKPYSRILRIYDTGQTKYEWKNQQHND